jgi:lactate dehydrogenase-like 2-hydroxyacid dehydrogenase
MLQIQWSSIFDRTAHVYEEPCILDNLLLFVNNFILTAHSTWYPKSSIMDLFKDTLNQIVTVLKGGVAKYWLDNK